MNTITLLAVTAVFLAPAPASAQSVLTSTQPSSLFSLKVTQPDPPKISVPKKDDPKPTPPKPAEPIKPVPVVYTVAEGDNLSKIGTAHNVEWQRLWAKNTQLEHPDRINVGDQITVPLADEVLSRELPAAVSLPAVTPGVLAPAVQDRVQVGVQVAPAPVASFSGGNTYDYGYCTWYVKNRRGASIPNMLGNANTWQARAAGQGMATGSTPRAGAVATTTAGAYGHVAYVESVNANGTINISEMNAPIWGEVTYRTANAGDFLYIY